MSSAQSTSDLSVIVVSWNTRDLLLRCLDSVRLESETSGMTVETIVVDNASSDGSPEAVTERFPDVTILAQEQNLGFAVANNLGIDRARGESILILNPDTELHPGSLAALRDALLASWHVGLVAPVLLNPDGSFQSAGYRFPGLTQTLLDVFPLHPRLMESRYNGRFDGGDGRTPYRIDHPLGACMLVRREVIDQVGALDPAYFIYSEEVDWCQRITAAGWTILCAPLARVTHHGGQSTSQAPETMRTQLHRSRARYLRRYQSDSFHRVFNAALSGGIALKRIGVPLPSGGRDIEDLEQIAAIYRGSDSEPRHD